MLHECSDKIDLCACKLTSIGFEDQQKFKQILLNNKQLFSEKLGCIKYYEHEIQLKQRNVKVRQTYPVTLPLREKVRDKINQMEKDGIIEISQVNQPVL